MDLLENIVLINFLLSLFLERNLYKIILYFFQRNILSKESILSNLLYIILLHLSITL